MRRSRSLVTVALVALITAGCEWHFEVLDGNGGPNGRTDNMVGTFGSTVIYNGRPHVFYYDIDDDTLRHGYHNGSFWAFEILDGPGGKPGHTDTLTGMHNVSILYNGRPHIFSFDEIPDTLRHAWFG